MTLSETLRFIRKRSGMTQRHVADKLGISTVTFSKIETGKISPRVSLLIDLADIYGHDLRISSTPSEATSTEEDLT